MIPLRELADYLIESTGYEIEVVPRGYKPLSMSKDGLVDLNPHVAPVDFISVSNESTMLAQIYMIEGNDKGFYINAYSFPPESGYRSLFLTLVRYVQCTNKYIATLPHHLTERNRVARTKATLKAHEEGLDISKIETNTAQLIGFLPASLLAHYGDDVKGFRPYYITVCTAGIGFLKAIKWVIDRTPSAVKAVFLRVALSRLVDYNRSRLLPP